MFLKKILFLKIPFLFFWLFFSLNIFSNNGLEVKAEYDGLISEIFQILNEDHFKKNTQVTEEKVLTNFLLNLDNICDNLILFEISLTISIFLNCSNISKVALLNENSNCKLFNNAL